MSEEPPEIGEGAAGGSRRDDRTRERPSPAHQANRRLRISSISSAGLFALAVIYSLHLAKDLLLPIFGAILLSLLLDPVVRGLHKWRIPRAVSALLLLLAFLAVSAFAVQRALVPAQEWIRDSPQLLNRLELRMQRLMKPVEEVTEAALEVERLAQVTPRDRGAPSVEVEPQPRLGSVLFAGTQSLLAAAAIILVLTFFLLSTGPRQLSKLSRLLPEGSARRRLLTAARRVQKDLSAHLLTITVINALLGTCVALLCSWAGLPNPVVWGVMAALLNFVPYLGAAMGMIVLAAAALLTFDNPWTALWLPLGYAALTGIEGTVVTPIVLGRRLSLNPLAILFALLFWGFLWGLPGALLAVPLLVAAKAVCSHVDELEPIAKMLS